MNVVVKNQNRGTGRVQKPSEIVMKTKDLTCQGVPEKTHFQNATERPRVKNPPVVIMIRISESAFFLYPVALLMHNSLSTHFYCFDAH